MTRRLTTFSLLLIFCINLSSYSNSIYSLKEPFAKKVYIILRTEQNPDDLVIFKNLVQDNLQFNNVSAQIDTYKVNQAIPQMKIFKNAYQQNFDLILLIDQVAKYNVGLSNRKVTVGGKFLIQSYYMKSSNPSWKNHGETNCNITVNASIKGLLKSILNSIQIDSKKTNHSPLITDTSISYNKSESKISEIREAIEIEAQLEEVRKAIELQKTKTKHIQSDIELLILKAKKELVLETEKLKTIQNEIKNLKHF